MLVERAWLGPFLGKMIETAQMRLFRVASGLGSVADNVKKGPGSKLCQNLPAGICFRVCLVCQLIFSGL